MGNIKVDCFKEGKFLGSFYIKEELPNNEIIDLYYRNFRLF